MSEARGLSQSLGQVSRMGLGPVYDNDAAKWFGQVEAIEGQPLEAGVKAVVSNRFASAKALGLWPAINTAVPLFLARTLAGGLIPFKGTLPTNFNFVAGDYNRKAGTKGNGLNKYLNSNVPANANAQDNYHAAVYVSQVHSGGGAYSGSLVTTPSLNRYSQFSSNNGNDALANRSFEFFQGVGGFKTGFQGTNRSSSTEFTVRWNNTSAPISSPSLVPGTANNLIFCFNLNGEANLCTSGRLQGYSFGSSLNLETYNTWWDGLVSEIGAILP